MRLGVLLLGHAPFGVLDTEVLTPLRALNIDVIVPEPDTPPVTTGVGATQAAERLHRADCDGTLIFVGRDEEEPTNGQTDSAATCAAQAALHLAAAPLLLSGLPSNAFFAVAGALTAVGVPFDRRFCTGDFDLAELPSVIHAWLNENRREERRRGSDAARGLYGQRLYVPNAFPTPDVAAWMHQFGLIVSRSAEGADFVAEDGDALAALTAHLLARIAGAEAKVVRTAVYGSGHGGHRSGEASKAVFARIVAQAGRYRCIIVRGELGGDLPEGRATVRGYDCKTDIFAIATFPEFCTVPGEHVGALRAACYALDIEPVVLL